MGKLTMAHEYALVRLTCSNPKTLDEIIKLSWYYADEMQAEADKRINKERPEVLCEVDWSVAPEWAKYHQDGLNGYIWVCENFEKIEEAPTFGFTGTHVVERPHGF